MFSFDVFDEEELDARIEKEFGGHGMAMRRREVINKFSRGAKTDVQS